MLFFQSTSSSRLQLLNEKERQQASSTGIRASADAHGWRRMPFALLLIESPAAF
jgi:hypothetical protein